MEIPFTGPAYRGESYFMNTERCVNFYPHPYPEGGNGKLALMGCSGLEAWTDLGTNAAIRGVIVAGAYSYAVSSNSFFRISPDGTAVEKGAGTIVSTSGLVSMSTNGLDITFVDGTKGYVYDIAADTLNVITDSDFPGSATIAFVDGYYFVHRPNTNQIHQSAFNDGTSWPGYVASAGSAPDNIVALMADHDELWAFCERTLEVWYNAVNSGFILAPRPAGFSEQGCAAAFSPAHANNAVYWLGRNLRGQGQVFQAVALEMKIVSTPSIEHQIAQYSSLADAIGFIDESVPGHIFYTLTFPTGDATWVYDTGNALWHERSSQITSAIG